jgi:hypothetical protein
MLKLRFGRFYFLLFSCPKRRHFLKLTLIWRRHHCRWRAAKFIPMLGAQGLWAGRDLYRTTPALTRYLGFSGLIRRTAPFSRLLRHTRGCGGSILTRILTGFFLVWNTLIKVENENCKKPRDDDDDDYYYYWDIWLIYLAKYKIFQGRSPSRPFLPCWSGICHTERQPLVVQVFRL